MQTRYRITAGDAARFTGNLASVAEMVEPVITRPLVLSDPAHDPVLYTAAEGKADALCTRNTRSLEITSASHLKRRWPSGCHELFRRLAQAARRSNTHRRDPFADFMSISSYRPTFGLP
ncbi:MAG: hypothetical protein ABSG65_16370 [Bryobacteraceae bacterium]